MHSASLAQTDGSFWFPPQAADTAAPVDFVFYVILLISLAFFVLVVAMMLLFVVRFRRRRGQPIHVKGPTSNLPLELTWTIVPLVIVIFIFALGLRPFLAAQTARAGAREVLVTGQKWQWWFEYPNGLRVPNELHVPVNTPMRLVLTSDDVIHSLFIPAFRLKRDAVPGRYTRTWVTATRPGEYPLLCAEYCGTSHSDMIGTVIVHEPGLYEVWLEEASRSILSELNDEQYAEWEKLETPEDLKAFVEKYPELSATPDQLQPPGVVGRMVYKNSGCTQCHTTDGTALIGPTFKGLWQRTTSGDTPLADDQMLSDKLGPDYGPEDYIRQSIVEPGSTLVRGYRNVMPAYKGKITDRQLTAFIQFLKTLDDADSSEN